MKPATNLIHAGAPDPTGASPLTPPIYETSTFVFDSAAEVVAYNEGRSVESTCIRATAIRRWRRWSGSWPRSISAEAALVFSSGMGAITTILMAHARAGDEIVCSAAIYGGTLHLLNDVLVKFGVRPRFVSLEELADPERVIGDATRIVWFESPINPTLRCVDIRRIADACRRARRPVGHRQHVREPAEPAAARARHRSLDAERDEVSERPQRRDWRRRRPGTPRWSAPIERARRLLGTVMDPYPAYALGRGLKTLPLRIAQHNANAAAVAQFLAADKRVSCVYYPGLASHPDHEIARRQMTGFGGMVCFDLDGRIRPRRALYDRLKVIKRAASLGGIESLISMPVLTSQWGHSDEQLRAAGRDEGHAAAVRRPRGRRRPDCRPRSGPFRLEADFHEPARSASRASARASVLGSPGAVPSAVRY